MSDMLWRHQCLDNFFSQANEACRLCEYDEPQSTLMHSDDIAVVKPRTEPPVEDRFLQHWPFLGFSPSQIIDFAQRHLHLSNLSPENFVILDERSNQDATCLVLSRNVYGEDAHDFVQTRADFESAVITLRTIEIGCGYADSQLSTDYPGYDGVLRISMESQGQR
jgi:hypothetical protein